MLLAVLVAMGTCVVGSPGCYGDVVGSPGCYGDVVGSPGCYGDVLLAGTLVVSMANLEGEETFEASYLGAADEVVQERVCDDELLLIKGSVRASTYLHTHYILNSRVLRSHTLTQFSGSPVAAWPKSAHDLARIRIVGHFAHSCTFYQHRRTC